MVNSKTDFFKIVNNFSRIEEIESIPIVKARFDTPPQINIVIPTHKRVNLLKDAIKSVLAQQEYTNFELIVVDDDPNRNCQTEELLKSYSDGRISYYKNSQNLGMINNWNRCFELACGDWVVMLHDDDLLLPSFLKDCMALLEKQPQIGMLKPKWYHWNDDGKELIVPEQESSNTLKRIYEISHLNQNLIGAPTGIIINKEKFTAIGGFNPEFFPSSDKCFTTLFAYYFEVYELDKVLSVYRWLLNDSLKVEVLRGFLVNDYYLFKYLCKRFGFPKPLANNFLNFKFRNIVGYYKSINPNFDFDKSIIGLKPVHKIPGKVAFILTNRLVAFYNKIYSKYGERIFEKRQQKLEC